MKNSLKVFGGRSAQELTQEICTNLKIPAGKISITTFANENIFVKVLENVRGKDVFLIQTSCHPVNDMLMELLIMIDAVRHASAERITAILPYYPYVRSDKKDQPRISITARLVADLLQTAGADRILTMNLHSFQVHGFFRIPVDHLLAAPILCDYFAQQDLTNTVAIAPDIGSAKRVEIYARALNLPLAIMDKRRSKDGSAVEMVNIIGEVAGHNVILFDDEISTAGSMVAAAETLKKREVLKINACAVHGVLCGSAIERLKNSCIEKLVVTNTVPVPKEIRNDKIVVLSVARMFAEAIARIHRGESVSTLFVKHL